MNISELTQQQVKEILIHAYKIGNEEDMSAKELVEEIKQQIIMALR